MILYISYITLRYILLHISYKFYTSVHLKIIGNIKKKDFQTGGTLKRLCAGVSVFHATGLF